MLRYANYLTENNRSSVIFPEGTRSKTGEPKRFQRKGLELLLKKMPDAYVVPITINNSWKLQRYGMFPMPLGVCIKYELHPLLKASDFEIEALINTVEAQVKSGIN
jgi:1-acyl-sn-glycerol-3-phosphate acyltransferase